MGVVIDGCPSLVPVTEEDIQRELDRRRPGQSDIVTPRKEEDRAEILSGVLDGRTLGTPIAISVRNKDHRSSAYDEMAHTYRRPMRTTRTMPNTASAPGPEGGVPPPGNHRPRSCRSRGEGRAEAGVSRYGNHRLGGQVHRVKASVDGAAVTAAAVEGNIVRTADPAVAEAMISAIKEARDAGNSLGGVVKCTVRGCPPDWGTPFSTSWTPRWPTP